ncbi:MAG: CPBP family intramembrane glutamic endopeptidase [Actinomycetota bacterium]
MTLAVDRIESTAAERANLLLFAALAGCVSLTARGPNSWRAIALTVGVGASALLAPNDRDQRAPLRVCVTALAVGIAAFAIVRTRSVYLPGVATLAGGAGSLVGAVAEEFFFRRLVYDGLARWGAPIAIIGAALAFAAVHVPVYGFAVLPIDITAGLILGWQRWSTGTVTVPALTHVAANLLVIV